MGYTDLPIDHGAVATALARTSKTIANQGNINVDWSTANAPLFLVRRHEIVPVRDAGQIEEVMAAIGQMLDEQSSRESPDLNRARWILAALTHLPVPMIWRETAARGLGRFTLRRLISWLGTGSRYDVGLGAIVQTLRMQFERLYELLEKSNPRVEALRTVLSQLSTVGHNEPTLVLVRDRVAERAVQTWLEMEAFPGDQRLSALDVRACSEYIPNSKQRYQRTVVVGALPRRHRWLAGAHLGETVTFIAYPHEMDVIEQQLLSIYGDGARDARSRRRRQALEVLVPYKSGPQNGSEAPIPRLELSRPTIQRAAESPAIRSPRQVVATSMDKLAEALEAARRTAAESQPAGPFLAPWQEDTASDDALEEEPGTEQWQGSIEDFACLRVEVESRALGRGVLWLNTEEIVECVRPTSPNDLQRLTPDKLQPGDVILRMEEGTRTSLFDRIVELAEGQPEMSYLASFRHAWRTAIQRIVAQYSDERGINYGLMLKALQREGATIQSELAVRFWVRDQVIGPEASSSIKAVGQVSGSTTLVREAKQFDRAFRTIRGIHQGIGRRLNSAIRKSFTHFAGGLPEEAASRLDDHLGLPLEELLETIDLAEVTAVSSNPESRPATQVGRFQKLAGG